MERTLRVVVDIGPPYPASTDLIKSHYGKVDVCITIALYRLQLQLCAYTLLY